MLASVHVKHQIFFKRLSFMQDIYRRTGIFSQKPNTNVNGLQIENLETKDFFVTVLVSYL